MTTENQPAGDTAAPEVKPASTEDVKPVTAEIKTDDSATPADNTDGSNPEEAAKPEPKKPDDAFQKKINKLTARAKAAEARADQLAAEVARSTAHQQPAQVIADEKPPRVDDFQSFEQFEAAKDKWLIDQAVRRLKSETEATERKRSSETEAERKRAAGVKFREKIEAAADRYEDLDSAVEAFHTGGIQVSVPMLEYVYEHADAPDAVISHLYGNPEIADKLAKLPAIAAVRELARIEATLAKPQPRKDTNAPPPPKVVKAEAESPTKRYEDMSMSEYAALRAKQMSAERARRYK